MWILVVEICFSSFIWSVSVKDLRIKTNSSVPVTVKYIRFLMIGILSLFLLKQTYQVPNDKHTISLFLLKQTYQVPNDKLTIIVPSKTNISGS